MLNGLVEFELMIIIFCLTKPPLISISRVMDSIEKGFRRHGSYFYIFRCFRCGAETYHSLVPDLRLLRQAVNYNNWHLTEVFHGHGNCQRSARLKSVLFLRLILSTGWMDGKWKGVRWWWRHWQPSSLFVKANVYGCWPSYDLWEFLSVQLTVACKLKQKNIKIQIMMESS